MAPLIFTNALFSLLLVLDSLLKTWGNPQNIRWKFAEHLLKLAKHETWIASNVQIKDYMRELDVSQRMESDFNKWCKELIGHSGQTYTTKGGRTLETLEHDFVLAYGLRNFSVHSVKSQGVLWENYTEVLQSLLNCLFKTIEML